MAWIILSILLWLTVAVATLTAAVITVPLRDNMGRETPERYAPFRSWAWVVPTVGLLIFGLMTLAFSFRQVKATEIGLVYEFGKITDTRGPGPTLIPPWAKFRTASGAPIIFEIDRKCRPDGEGEDELEHCIGAASNEPQNVYLTSSLSFSIADCKTPTDRKCEIDEAKVIDLYRQVGPDWIDKVIRRYYEEVPKRVISGAPRVCQVTTTDEDGTTTRSVRSLDDEKLCPRGFRAAELLPNRALVSRLIEEAFREQLATDPRYAAINIISFNMPNIEFDSGYDAQLKANAEAIQQIEIERQRVEVAKQVAQQAVEQAKGEADAAVARAEGEAEANAKINASLTPELLQLKAIESLSDNVQIALLPADSGFILDPLSFGRLAGATP